MPYNIITHDQTLHELQWSIMLMSSLVISAVVAPFKGQGQLYINYHFQLREEKENKK